MKEGFGIKLLLMIDELVSTTQVIFSRQSLMQKISQMEKIGARGFNRSLKRYGDSGIIESYRRDNKDYYRLTKKGVCRLLDVKIKRIIGSRGGKWDGYWRLIIFDIPEDRKFAREALRRRLKYFNFFPLQKSVFVFPYKCEDEIRALGEYFIINDNIEIILTKSLGRIESAAKAFFEL